MKPPLEPGELLADKYRIEALLGQGGMGAVFRAMNVDLGRPVAIKVLRSHLAHDPDTVARFRQEARAAAAIGHPSIIDVLDLGRTADGAEFIVMEYLRGESLGAKLAREGRLSVPATLAITRGILDALEAAHACGITHRDLKPDNIFLAAPPVSLVKVLDFGISKLATGQEEGIQTATGALMGTPAYMAPEQAQGQKSVGPPADLYALGVILYEMLAGRPVFGGQTFMEILLKVVGEAPEPLAKLRGDLPPELIALVMQLLAKTPSERPASATAVRARLDALSLATAAASEAGDEAFAPTLPPTELAPEAVRVVALGEDLATADTAAPVDPRAMAPTAAASPSSPVDTVDPASELALPVSRWRAWLVVAAAVSAFGFALTVIVLKLASPPQPDTQAAVDAAPTKRAARADLAAGPRRDAAPKRQVDRAMPKDSGPPALDVVARKQRPAPKVVKHRKDPPHRPKKPATQPTKDPTTSKPKPAPGSGTGGRLDGLPATDPLK